MKSKWFVLLGLLVNSVFVFGTKAQATEIEANIKYPVPMGSIGQGFSPMIGFGASLYFAPLLDPAISNFISVAYDSYRIKADGLSSMKVIPVLAMIELPGKVFKDFNSTLAAGAGFATGFVSVPVQTSYTYSAWFALQIKPGFDWMVSDGFSIVGHTPVTMLISRKFMSSMDFDVGVKFKL
jgi:hypothetical protein